jgi:hypothetical protein
MFTLWVLQCASKEHVHALTSHSLYDGPPPELPMTEILTRLQVERHFIFLKENKFAANKDIDPQVADSLNDNWNRAGIPAMPLKDVKIKLLRLMEDTSQASEEEKQNQETCRKFK